MPIIHLTEKKSGAKTAPAPLGSRFGNSALLEWGAVFFYGQANSSQRGAISAPFFSQCSSVNAA